MFDTSTEMTATVVCPDCKAETIERQPLGKYEYRCLRCGMTFDAAGDEPPLAGSDNPDAP